MSARVGGDADSASMARNPETWHQKSASAVVSGAAPSGSDPGAEDRQLAMAKGREKQ